MSKQKPKLALDMYVLTQGIKTGVHRVCDELFPLLTQSGKFDTQLYFRPADQSKVVSLSERLNARAHSAPAHRPSEQADILLSPFGVAPTEWRLDDQVLHAHIVYDLIGIQRPDYFSIESSAEVRRIMDSLDENTVIFAISEFTKKDLLAYRPDLSPQQITVIPLAAGRAFSPCSDVEARAAMRVKYGIPPGVPYVLSLATLEIRKNLDQVVNAFVACLEQNAGSKMHLVLSGMTGWKLEQLHGALAAAKKWRHRIVLTGFVDDVDLSALYSDSLCFVYLSRYEGFGLPPLEAMACGTPVVCSDNSSLPEVVGQAGLLFDADDVSGVAGALDRIATQPGLRQQLAHAGLERAKLFTWHTCAAIVVEALVASAAIWRTSRLGGVHRDTGT